MADSATGAPGTVHGQAASYDALDRLTSLDGESNAYTADGLLGWTQTPGASSATYFVYDGDTPVGEIDSNGTATAANLFGPSGLVERSDDAGGSRYYVFDPQGNTAVRLYGYYDNNYGTVLDTHAFDAYGQELTQDATNDPYAGFGAEYGYRTDRATGLDLLGHRFYDPVTARFVTRDPIGYAGGLNEYEYAGNNPVNRSDPSGFDEGPDEWEGVPYEFGGEAPMGDPELNASQGSRSMSEAEWNAVELEGPQAVERAYDETVLGHSPEYLAEYQAATDEFEKAPASTVDFGLGNGAAQPCMQAEADEFSTAAPPPSQSSIPAGGQLSLPFDDAPAGESEPIRWHHPWPKYLGGEEDQPLVGLPKSYHDAIHDALDQIYPRERGAQAYQNVPRSEIEQNLQSVYNQYPISNFPWRGVGGYFR